MAKSQTNDEQAFLNAVKIGDSDIVRNFLSRDDVNVNVHNNEGLPAIHIALFSREIEILEMLLADLRTDVNALGHSNDNDNDNDNDIGTVLFEAAYWDKDDAEFTKALLKHPEINVNFQIDGMTALHRSAFWSRLEVVRVLSNDPRIDLHIKGRYGTAFNIAYRERDRRVYNLLLSKIGRPPYKDPWILRCATSLLSFINARRQ